MLKTNRLCFTFLLDLPDHAHFHIKKKLVQFLTWCFQKLSSFSYCWWKQGKGKDSSYFSLYIYANNRKSTTELYSLPSAEMSLFSSLTLHFFCFLDKVKIFWLVKSKIHINLDIAVTDSAGNPLACIAAVGVAIFQILRVKLSIIWCCSWYHILQIVLL